MSNNSNGTNITMSSSQTASKSAKKVAKKTAVVVASETSVPQVVQPVAAPVVAAPVANVVAPTAASVPSAQAVSVAITSVPSISSSEDIDTLFTQLQAVRDSAVGMLRTLKRLQKSVSREVKEAGRRRRHRHVEGDVVKEKRPTIFTTPVALKDELCTFLGKPVGHKMTPADVTRAFSAYVESHKLKDAEKGHTIHPDAAMRKVLGIKESDDLTYRNIQSYLYKLYKLPERKHPSRA